MNEEDLHTLKEATKWASNPRPIPPDYKGQEYWWDLLIWCWTPIAGPTYYLAGDALDPFIDSVKQFFKDVTKTYDDAHKWVTEKWDKFKDYVADIGTKLTNLYDEVIKLIDTLIKYPITVWDWVKKTWDEITDWTWEFLGSIWDWVKRNWDDFLDYVWRLAWSIYDWIVGAWGWIVQFLGDLISGICEAVRTTTAYWYDPIRAWTLDRWEGIQRWVLEKWGLLKTYILEYWARIQAWVVGKYKEYWDWIKKNVPSYWVKVKDFLGGILKEVWEYIIKTVMSVKDRYVPGVVDAISRGLGWLDEQFRYIMGRAYDEITEHALSYRPMTPARSLDLAKWMFASAVGFGVLSHGLAQAVEMIPNIKYMGVHYMSAFAARMGGFGLISSATMGVIAALALRVPFTYYVNDLLRPTIPDDKLLIEFRAKREIDFSEFKRYMAFHGHSDEWTAKIDSWLWKDPRLFEILYCADVTVPPREWLVRKFERAGYEDIDVDVLCKVVERRTTRSPRTYFTSAMRRNYRHGFLTEQELIDGIEDLEMAPDGVDWIIRAGELDVIYETYSDLVTAYRTAFRNDVITEGQCLASLAALGLPKMRSEAIVYLEWVRKYPRATKAERKEIEEPWAELQADYSRAYIESFRRGLITQEELVAYLVAIGIEEKVARVTAFFEAVKLVPKPKPEQIPAPILPAPVRPPTYES